MGVVHDGKVEGAKVMTTDLRRVQLSDFLTESQIKAASTLSTAKRICEQVIVPNLTEINRKLGQENDPMYLAYMCEYVLTIVAKGRHGR